MSENPLWNEFEQFYLDHCMEYCSPAKIDLSYGNLLILDPADDASMIYAGDLNMVDGSVLLSDLEAHTKHWKVPGGIYFSPSWKGDIEKFKNTMTSAGYQKTHCMQPHLLNDLSVVDSISKSDFDICEAEQGAGEVFSDLFKECFQCPQEMAKQYKNYIDNPAKRRNKVKVAFFIAYSKSSEPVGMAACSYNKQFGYMNSLGVRKEYRKQGIASHLVRTRLEFLRKLDISNVVTIVASQNEGSLKTQAKIGYRHWVDVPVWKKDLEYIKKI